MIAIRTRRFIAAMVLAVSVLFVPNRDHARAGDSAGYQGMAVSTVKAESKCFKEHIQASGFLVAKSEVDVWSERVGLQIGQIFVEPGDSVGAGQVLARLVAPSGAPPQTVPIRSPVSGIVVGVTAIVGSSVTPSAADPLFRIVVDGALEMRGEVVASALAKLQVGQAATLHVIGFGPLEGHVASIESAIDPLTQLGAVHIAFAQDARLRPGVFGRAAIEADTTCAVAVPLSAVLFGGDGGDVVDVVKGDHVETRRVDVGLSQEGFVQILDGVDQGDVVVERAGVFLREGDRVRPVGPPSNP